MRVIQSNDLRQTARAAPAVHLRDLCRTYIARRLRKPAGWKYAQGEIEIIRNYLFPIWGNIDMECFTANHFVSLCNSLLDLPLKEADAVKDLAARIVFNRRNWKIREKE